MFHKSKRNQLKTKVASKLQKLIVQKRNQRKKSQINQDYQEKSHQLIKTKDQETSQNQNRKNLNFSLLRLKSRK